MPGTFQVTGNLADFGNAARAKVKVRAVATPGIKVGDTAIHSNEPEEAVTGADGSFTLNLITLPGVWYTIQTPYSNNINTVTLAGYLPDPEDSTTGDRVRPRPRHQPQGRHLRAADARLQRGRVPQRQLPLRGCEDRRLRRSGERAHPRHGIRCRCY